MKRKRIIKFASLMIGICMMLFQMSFCAFAGAQDDIPDEAEMNKNWVNVSVYVDGSYGYPETLTIHMDSTPIHISGAEFVDGIYNAGRQMAPGVHKVSVISRSDIDEIYGYAYPETFTAAEGGTLKIIVTEGTGEQEVFDAIETPLEDFYEEAPDTPEIDMSDGEESATAVISCKYCAAVKSLTYSLMGKEIYDITLDRDHSFESIVKLPAGSYKELALMAIEMDEDVLATEITYSLAHSDNKMLYGAVYDMDPGETMIIDDLQVMMNVNGDVVEADSNALFAAKQLQNYTDISESRMKEKLRDNEILEEDTEPATIAAAVPVVVLEENHTMDIDTIILIALIIAIPAIIIIICLIVRKKIKDKNKYFQ